MPGGSVSSVLVDSDSDLSDQEFFGYDPDEEYNDVMDWLTNVREHKEAFEHLSHEELSWETLDDLERLWEKFKKPLLHQRENSKYSLSQLVRILGPDCKQLMENLCVKITNRVMLRGRKVQSFVMIPSIRIKDGRLRKEDWPHLTLGGTCQRDSFVITASTTPSKIVREFDSEGTRALEAVAQYGRHRGRSKYPVCSFPLIVPHVSAQVDIYWCSLPLHIDSSSFLHFAVALAESPAGDLFETPLGQMIAKEAWDASRSGWYWRRLTDLLTVAMLVNIGLHSRISHQQDMASEVEADAWDVFPLVFVNVVNITRSLVEGWACLKAFRTLRPLCQPFIVINWIMEMVICGLSFGSIGDIIRAHNRVGSIEEEVQRSWIYQHPVMIASLIFVKWLQLNQRAICLDLFINSVLPAWQAIRSPPSISFLVFLTNITVGAFFAYFSLPRHNWRSHQLFAGRPSKSNSSLEFMQDIQESIGAVLELTVMNNYDVSDIEGMDTRLDGDQILRKTGEVAEMHYHLPIFVLVNAFLFGVIFLNLYVGILSEEYQRAKQNIVQLRSKHRIITALPHLLSRYAFHLWGLGHLARNGHHMENGFWFSVPQCCPAV